MIKIDSLGLHVTTAKVIENCIIKEWKQANKADMKAKTIGNRIKRK